MPNCADPTRLSPEERPREVATILANGVLRLRQRAALPAKKGGKNLEKQPSDSLEFPAETRLSVRVG